jgi:hypothetical protein
MTIDQVCQMTTNPTMLNALHACRPDHPLGKTTPAPWSDALFLARQQKSYVFSGAVLDWIEKQAAAELVK